MAVPFFKEMKIGAYIMKQKLMGRKRYPLVLMLEPLFRCNLACSGCGKIDYPDAILNRRLSVQECLDAVDECGAPMVAIPGGEPLIHKDIGAIVKGHRGAQEVRLAVHQCAAAGEEARRVRALALSVLLGASRRHQEASRQVGVHGRRLRARLVGASRPRKAKGFAVNVNATIFDGHPAEDIAGFLDLTQDLGVGVTISPGYAYERAPDQEHFLKRRKTKELFRKVFALGKGKNWKFMHSGMFLDFLAGNQEFPLHPVGHADAQRFRLAEALLPARRRLRQDLHRADGDHRLGCLRHRRIRKVRELHGALRLRGDRRRAMFKSPLKAIKIALCGVAPRPDGAGNSLENQRPAQYVFADQVQQSLTADPRRRSAGEGPQTRQGRRGRHPRGWLSGLFGTALVTRNCKIALRRIFIRCSTSQERKINSQR